MTTLDTMPILPGGKPPSGKHKRVCADQHELAGFPASSARYQIQIAASLIRGHVEQKGGSPLLTNALSWLDKAACDIEEWRKADMERTNYPYQRKVGRA